MIDLSNWLTEAEAAARLGIGERTLRDHSKQGKGPERRMRQREGLKPQPVYNPDDVARLAASPPAVFSRDSAIAPLVQIPQSLMAPGSPGEQLVKLLVNRLQEPPPRRPARWLDLRAASALTGLSVALLRRLIASNRLKAIRDRSIKVLQADLDDLEDLADVVAGFQRPAKLQPNAATSRSVQ